MKTDFVSWNLTVTVNGITYEVLTENNSSYKWFGITDGYDPITATLTGLFEDFNPADGRGNEAGVGLDANDSSIVVLGQVFGNEPDFPNGYYFYTDPNSNAATVVIPEQGLLQFGTPAAAVPGPIAGAGTSGLGVRGLRLACLVSTKADGFLKISRRRLTKASLFDFRKSCEAVSCIFTPAQSSRLAEFGGRGCPSMSAAARSAAWRCS